MTHKEIRLLQRLGVMLLLLIIPFMTSAQESAYRNSFTVEGSLSMSDTYDYAIGMHRMFCKYAGLGGYIGMWSAIPDGGMIGESGEERAEKQNPFVKPSIRLLSPPLFSLKKCRFSIGCEPGLMISARQKIRVLSDDSKTYKEYKTDCISWNCNWGLNLRYSVATFTVFYAISNLDVNRSYQTLQDKNSYRKKIVESVGVRMALSF